MKRFKFLLPLFVVLLAVGVAFATRPAEQSTKIDDDVYWQYVSGPFDEPGSYTEFGQESPGCQGATTLCSIRAPKNAGGEPVLPANINQMVQDLIDNSQHQSTDGSIVLKSN